MVMIPWFCHTRGVAYKLKDWTYGSGTGRDESMKILVIVTIKKD